MLRSPRQPNPHATQAMIAPHDFPGGEPQTRPSSAAWRGGLFLAAAAALVAAAAVVRRRCEQAERENPPLGKFVEVDGVRLHYMERGSGQPLVLIHGMGSMIPDFVLSGLVDRAAEKYRVIVFDRPGYGYSERPRTRLWSPQVQAALLHHALRKLGIEQAIVAGHSWGTQVALAMALNFPGFVTSLVLLSGYYYPTARVDVPLLSPPAVPVIGDLMRYTISPLLGRLLWPAVMRRIFGPAPVSPGFSEFPVWLSLRPSQLRASAADTAFLIPAAVGLSRRYAELHMPVVIMAGDADRYVNTGAHSLRLHKAIAHSDLALQPGAGHMIHHLAPEAVMAAIARAAHLGASIHGTQSSATITPLPTMYQSPPHMH